MIYPTISEYIESIKYAEDNFATLTNLRPFLDDYGNPIMSSGNFAVVFKMKNEVTGKLHAVKCFLKEQDGRAEAYKLISEELDKTKSTYILAVKYIEKELFVNSNQSDETDYPILIMDWVEGIPLDIYIKKMVSAKQSLSMLICHFVKLIEWLLPQPFAHCDLKPDNIIITNENNIVLVDYDGMYTPSMSKYDSREFGSPNFRHPQRSRYYFDERTDDFSLASILLSLVAIEYDNTLYNRYCASDRLLLSDADYVNLKQSPFLNEISLSENKDLSIAMSFFMLAINKVNLMDCMHVLEVLINRQFERIQVICHGPNLTSEYYLNSLFGSKSNNVEKNQEKAFNLFLELAKLGSKDAQCCLGCCYRDGKGVFQNYDNAAFWYKKAIIQGEHRSPGHFTRMIELLFNEQDYTRAMRLIDFALKHSKINDGIRMHIAFGYENGWGTNVNRELALKWFERITSANIIYAIAISYLQGKVFKKSIPIEPDKGVMWLKKAVNLNHWESIVLLGEFYENGKFVLKNKIKSQVLYKQAKSNLCGLCYLLQMYIKRKDETNINSILDLIETEIRKDKEIIWKDLTEDKLDALDLLRKLLNSLLNDQLRSINPHTLKMLISRIDYINRDE